MTRKFKVADPIDIELFDGQGVPPEDASVSRVAMFVCHGMGQQVPFETLDAVASAIAEKHTSNRPGAEVDVVLRFVRPSGTEKLIPRVELMLKVPGESEQEIHLYEAYWAPLTEGKIGYGETVFQLLKAGYRGMYEGIKNSFRRWMFGGEKQLPIDAGTFGAMLGLLLVLIPVLLLPFAGFNLIEVIKNQGVWSSSAAFVLVWIILTYFIRHFIIEYMGDVIIYVNSNEVNEHWRTREAIKQVGLNLAKVVYSAVTLCSTEKKSYLYSQIVIVGHSLGSVLAYDTLNAILNQDKLDHDKLQAAKRTQALITLGSPLDKVAFLFRQKAQHAFSRDVLSAAYQPLILDYRNRPRWWINVFCRCDIISGSLEYYDDPQCANSEPRRVRNYVDPYRGWNVVKAHTDYWNREVAQSFLYLAASGKLHALENESFVHGKHHIPIRHYR